MGRKYSDAFVDRQIAKIDEMYEKCMGRNLIVTPECLIPNHHSYWNTYERPKLSESEINKIREYYNQLQNLSYVRGFWMGWTLREGAKET